jgi:hypothetical protein
MIRGSIPRDSSWCALCYREKKLCKDHRDPNDKDGTEAPVPYEGHDVYQPSEWIQSILGKRYTYCDRIYVCFGYDPRAGVWMRTVDDDGPEKISNISERAVDATFHRIRMSHGAKKLLPLIQELGRMPSDDEAPHIAMQYAPNTLYLNGFTTKSGEITELGRAELAKPEDERRSF